MRQLIGPNWFTFADDFKFVLSAFKSEHKMAQSIIIYVGTWSKEHHMLLLFEKCTVLHCIKSNKSQICLLSWSCLMSVCSQFKDLGVVRSWKALYSHHVSNLAVKCVCPCGSVRHIFRSWNSGLLWIVFKVYIKPEVIYVTSFLTYCRTYRPKVGYSHALFED